MVDTVTNESMSSLQIYKLETEHKRLEEDAAVCNLLQEQLKLSPAYKTVLTQLAYNVGSFIITPECRILTLISFFL